MVVLVFVRVRSGAGAQLSVEPSAWRSVRYQYTSPQSRRVSQSGDAHGGSQIDMHKVRKSIWLGGKCHEPHCEAHSCERTAAIPSARSKRLRMCADVDVSQSGFPVLHPRRRSKLSDLDPTFCEKRGKNNRRKLSCRSRYTYSS
jgi:hypothetical protein